MSDVVFRGPARHVVRAGLAALVTCVWAAGCTSGGGGGGTASGACAPIARFDGHPYSAVVEFQFTASERLGSATIPQDCDDTGGKGEQEAPPPRVENAYRVADLDPERAIAVGDSPTTVDLYVSDPDPLPPPVREFIDTHRDSSPTG